MSEVDNMSNERDYSDIMLDLETTGTRPGCCILSIGACTFDEKATFYETISHSSCISLSLKDSPDTMAWWSRQAPIARMEAFSGTNDLIAVLGKFSDWYKQRLGTKFIWGNGADFDLPILVACYDAIGMKQPWAPYNGRCYRTLKNLFKDIPIAKFEGIRHNALDDARMQSRHALAILRERKRQNQIVASCEANSAAMVPIREG